MSSQRCAMASLKSLDDLSFSGHGLSVEERAGLEVAFAKARVESGFSAPLSFFGRLAGLENDYFVAYGYGASSDYPQKQFFFWCVRPSAAAVPSSAPSRRRRGQPPGRGEPVSAPLRAPSQHPRHEPRLVASKLVI